MTVVKSDDVSDLFYEVAVRSATGVSDDCLKLLQAAYKRESVDSARELIGAMIENAEKARRLKSSVCQSPGYPTVYITLGGEFDVRCDIKEIIGQTISRITREGYLRPSIVHPITRRNTGDNSGVNVPAFTIDYDSETEYLEMVLSFKGCGVELFGDFKVFTTAQMGVGGVGVKRFILETIARAGSGPCPPTAVGVGMGGQIHQAANLSRWVTSFRRWDDGNPDPDFAEWERELLVNANKLDIGASGMGGDTTCLAVKVGAAYTHTAILPVVVNFHCWVARRARGRIYRDGSTEVMSW